MRTGGDDIAQALALIGARRYGSGQRPGDRVRDPAGLGARPAARRCDLARLRLFPRRVSRARSTCSIRAARAVAALDEPADINPLAARIAAGPAARSRPHGAAAARSRAARRLSGFRLEARRLRGRPAGADRRAASGTTKPISPRRISAGAATPMARARGPRRARTLERAARGDRCGAPQPGQPRARPARQRRLLPVRGRPGRRRAGACRAARRRSITTTIRGPRARASARSARGDRPRRARPRRQSANGSPA